MAAVLAVGCAALPPHTDEPGEDPDAARAGAEVDTTSSPEPPPPPDSVPAGGGPDTAAEPEPPGPEAEEARTPEYPYGPVRETDVELLRAMGPVYTPYDRSPVLEPGRWLRGLLEATVLPVIERHDFSPERQARFWVLVDREGEVVDAVLQLTSGSAAFDRAARAVAENLRYVPARREGRPVPVWILEPVSLLMR